MVGVSSQLPSPGWIQSIGDYKLIERIGTYSPFLHCLAYLHFSVNNSASLGFKCSYEVLWQQRSGVSCTIKAGCSCTRDCSWRIIIGVWRVCIKICYHMDTAATTETILQETELELNMFGRLPRHDNIARIEHYFIDDIPNPKPVDWDAAVGTTSTVHRYGAATFIAAECH